MVWAAFVIAICFSGLIGYYARNLSDILKVILTQLRKEPQKPEKPESGMQFAEPLDPKIYAIMEERERIRKLNEQ